MAISVVVAVVDSFSTDCNGTIDESFVASVESDSSCFCGSGGGGGKLSSSLSIVVVVEFVFVCMEGFVLAAHLVETGFS